MQNENGAKQFHGDKVANVCDDKCYNAKSIQ